MGLFLIALGGILLLALRTGSGFGLNLHVVGVIMMVVGILGLLLPTVAQGPRRTGRAAGSAPRPCTTFTAPPRGMLRDCARTAGSSTLTGPDVSVTNGEIPGQGRPCTAQPKINPP